MQYHHGESLGSTFNFKSNLKTIDNKNCFKLSIEIYRKTIYLKNYILGTMICKLVH